jgi:N-acetylglucosaminyldiphosphoundecaprenol N-acetyl-beta-D-mannosaminyltransferase
VTTKNILDAVKETLLANEKNLTVACANAYYAIETYNNEELASILNSVDILHADGAGVRWSLRFLYAERLSNERITGTDLYHKILELANTNSWRLFLFGDSQNVISTAITKINSQYPKVQVVGSYPGYIDIDNPEPRMLINQSKPNILFLGLGMPRQEYWLKKYRTEIQVPVCVVVGGGIAFVSGLRKRAPQSMRSMGLEWVFRLFQEPKILWRRYLLGIPQFLFYIVRQKVQQT